jgi:hypothetical protein
MSWYRGNRWLANFVIAVGIALLLALWFLFFAKGDFAEAAAQFNGAAAERKRLEHLDPFPNEENFRKTQTALDNYGVALTKIENELSAQTLPIAPVAPNEFQSSLRQAIVSASEKARSNRVKLPDNFNFGFDEFTTTLPGSAAAATLLAQELGQLELLLGILIDAHIDAITNLKRSVTAAEATALPASARATPSVVKRAIVDLTFTAAPSALRRVLNQIASSEQQFFIVRTLSVRNEQLKGPSREQVGPNAMTATSPSTAIKFIVGKEHLEATARVELVRFDF